MPGEQWTDTEDRDLLDFLYNELRSRDPTRKENAQLYRGNRVWKRYVEMNPDTKRSFQSLQSHFRRHVWGEKFCYLNYPPEKLFYLIKHLGQTVKSEDKQWLEKRWPYKLVISTKGFLQEYKRDTSPRKKPAEDLDESEETPRKKKRNALETSTSEVPDSQPPLDQSVSSLETSRNERDVFDFDESSNSSQIGFSVSLHGLAKTLPTKIIKKRIIRTEHASSHQNGDDEWEKSIWDDDDDDDENENDDETTRVTKEHLPETSPQRRETRAARAAASPQQSPLRPAPKATMKTSPKKRTINTEHASSMQNERGDERKKGWRSALGDDHDETARVIEDHFWETRLPPREDRLPPAEPHQSPRRPSPKSPRKPSPKKIAPTFEPDEDVIMNNSDEEVQFEEIMQETMRPAGPENWTLPIALPPRRHDPPNFLAMGQNCTAKATQQEPPITAKETPQQEELSSQASLTSLPTTPLMIRKRNVCRNVKSLDRPTFSQKGILKQRDDLSSSTITISTTSIAASVVHLGETQPPMKKIGKNLLTLSSVSSVSFIDPILKKKAEKEVEQRGQNEKQQQQEQQQEQVAPILPTPEPHRSEVMKAEPLVEDFDDENWKAEFDEKKRRELIEEIFQSIQRIPRKILEKTFDNMLLLEAEYYKIAKRRSDYLVKMADLHVDLRRKATFYG